MKVTFYLLRHYLFPREGNLLSFALWISVLGVALGIIQLMIVLSVMTGFQRLFQENYTRITGEIVVVPRFGGTSSRELKSVLEGVKGVGAFTPFGLGQGMVIRNGSVGGVALEGIDMATTRRVTPWKNIWLMPPDEELQRKNDWIWLGAQLAVKLNAKVGDHVSLLIADGTSRKMQPFLVTAITKFGIYDHDMHYARVDIDVLNRFFQRADLEPMYKIRAAPDVTIDSLVEQLRLRLGGSASVKKWSDIHQNVFLAVEHQKQMLFIVLEIVVALAAMNVVNLLMMSTHHRRKDMAILRAMGLRASGVLSFFVVQGTAVGMVGVIAGIFGGIGACRLIERFQPSLLSESIYNVTRVPIRIQVWDVTVISAMALVLCVVFSIFPALRAALARPVDALRYD